MNERVFLLERMDNPFRAVFRSPTRAFAYVDEIEPVGHTWEREQTTGIYIDKRGRWTVTQLPFNPHPHGK